MKSSLRQIAASARLKAVLQSPDFARLGIHPQEISRLVGKGQLIRVGRGRYVLPQAEHSENLGLALVSAAVPQSVICLLSALRFHGIGTQAPHDVWIAVKQGAARPRLDYPPVRVDASLRSGVYIRCQASSCRWRSGTHLFSGEDSGRLFQI